MPNRARRARHICEFERRDAALGLQSASVPPFGGRAPGFYACNGPAEPWTPDMGDIVTCEARVRDTRSGQGPAIFLVATFLQTTAGSVASNEIPVLPCHDWGTLRVRVASRFPGTTNAYDADGRP